MRGRETKEGHDSRDGWNTKLCDVGYVHLFFPLVRGYSWVRWVSETGFASILPEKTGATKRNKILLERRVFYFGAGIWLAKIKKPTKFVHAKNGTFSDFSVPRLDSMKMQYRETILLPMKPPLSPTSATVSPWTWKYTLIHIFMYSCRKPVIVDQSEALVHRWKKNLFPIDSILRSLKSLIIEMFL